MAAEYAATVAANTDQALAGSKNDAPMYIHGRLLPPITQGDLCDRYFGGNRRWNRDARIAGQLRTGLPGIDTFCFYTIINIASNQEKGSNDTFAFQNIKNLRGCRCIWTIIKC